MSTPQAMRTTMTPVPLTPDADPADAAATRIRLTDSTLADLAAGSVAPETVRLLLRAQFSGDSLLASHAIGRLPESEKIAQAVQVLSQAQRRDAGAVEALCHQTWWGAWASRCLSRTAPTASDHPRRWSEAARIAALAVSASARVGHTAETWALSAGGRLHLPGIATVPIGTRRHAWVRVTTAGGTVHVHRAGERPLSVAPVPGRGVVVLRTLQARHHDRVLSVVLDDLDPYRDLYRTTLKTRLGRHDFSRWLELLTVAWTLLCDHAPHLADVVAHGVRVLVPLVSDPARGDISVTSREAMGAMGLSLPSSPQALAVALVHEQAHSTLNGVLNLVPLHDRSSTEMFFAPWRPDPRPLLGTLHGVFAFLAVSEAWLGLCQHPALRSFAQDEFALRRVQLDVAINALSAAHGLTPAGRLFVAGMRSHCDRLLSAPTAQASTRRAGAILATQRAAWQHRGQRLASGEPA